MSFKWALSSSSQWDHIQMHNLYVTVTKFSSYSPDVVKDPLKSVAHGLEPHDARFLCLFVCLVCFKFRHACINSLNFSYWGKHILQPYRHLCTFLSTLYELTLHICWWVPAPHLSSYKPLSTACHAFDNFIMGPTTQLNRPWLNLTTC